VLCDKCGKEAIGNDDGMDGMYEVFDFDFDLRIGSHYPGDSFSGDKYRLDLCQTCAEQAMQLLLDNGFKVYPY
jgi:hypothetical protein